MVQIIENFTKVIDQLEKERGVSKDALFEAVEAAIVSASRKKFHLDARLRAQIDRNTGELKVFITKKVVENPADPDLEVSLPEALKINKEIALEGDVEFDVTPKDFGRLAAQTAKQVIIQRIREAEKETAYGEFKGKEGDLVVGTIQKHDYKNYLVNLGRLETTLAPGEQIPGEVLNSKDRVKFYVSEVKKTVRGPVIVISRSHPNLVKKLFELEIPEIAEGTIEIKAIVREPGRRTKVAVYSYDDNLAAVGTCIGYMGGRIQNVLKELGKERVDIIEYNNDPKLYISNSLKPAKISQIILSTATRSARVLVAEDQLSLAIGRDGQNVRLASKLTGWNIDIISEPEAKKKGLVEEPETAGTEVPPVEAAPLKEE